MASREIGVNKRTTNGRTRMASQTLH